MPKANITWVLCDKRTGRFVDASGELTRDLHKAPQFSNSGEAQNKADMHKANRSAVADEHSHGHGSAPATAESDAEPVYEPVKIVWTRRHGRNPSFILSS